MRLSQRLATIYQIERLLPWLERYKIKLSQIAFPVVLNTTRSCKKHWIADRTGFDPDRLRMSKGPCVDRLDVFNDTDDAE